ncbi:metallophosphoesterase [Pseudoroseomonas wenyumeiae]
MNVASTSTQVPSLAALRAGFKGLRVVGDVHGDANGFGAALAGAKDKRLFTVQLGDLTDRGPDSAATLRMALEMVTEHQGIFLLGNHDHKLRRALSGALVRPDPEGLGVTLKQIAAAPDAEALRQGRWMSSAAPRPGCAWALAVRSWRLPPAHAAGTAAPACRQQQAGRAGSPGVVWPGHQPHPHRRLSGAAAQLGAPHPFRHHCLLRA